MFSWFSACSAYSRINTVGLLCFRTGPKYLYPAYFFKGYAKTTCFSARVSYYFSLCYYDKKKKKNMNLLFSPYFENVSTYYSPCKVLSRNSYGKSDFLTVIFEFGLPPLLNSKMTGTSWDELGRVGPQRK